MTSIKTKLILSAVFLLAVNVATARGQMYADTVFYNGNVLTANHEDPSQFQVAQAVAVHGNRIVAVGTDTDVRRFGGPATRSVDLKGKTLLPGLIDTHSHIHDYGMSHHGKELAALPPWFWNAPIKWDTKQAGLNQIKGLASQKKPGDWLYTSINWNTDLPLVWKEVTVRDLDPVTPNTPLYIDLTVEQNHAMVNSRALNLLLAKYPAGLPGMEKDAKGAPTGLLRGVAAATVYQELIPKPPFDLVGPIYEKEMAEWVAMGITTISSRLPGYVISDLAALERAGKMPLRMPYAHQMANDSPDPKTAIQRLGNLNGAGTEKLWFIGVTPVNIDGIVGMGWGCVEKAYPREHPNFPLWRHQLWGPNGECTLTNPAFSDRDVIIGAIESGHHRITAMHVGGDRSLNQLLDLLEKTDPKATIRDRRFAVDHCRFVDAQHVERAKKYQLMFSCAPKYVHSGARGDIGAFGAIYGPDVAADVVVPMRRLIDAGLRPVMELDTHGMYSFLNLEVLVTRKDSDGRVWGPQQRINRREALYTFTRWAARYILAENDLGSIEPGKKADFIVVDRDYLTVPEEEISDLKVLLAMVNGKLEFTDQEFAGTTGLPQVGFRGTPPWTVRERQPQ